MGKSTKTVFTIQPYEEGLRSDGFYEVKTAEEAFALIEMTLKNAKHPVRFVFRKHEVELDCDVCSSGSIKESITLYYEGKR